ncbi:MAG TPA: FAD-dependent oxidoreductase [Acidobacteriota bacterium]
MDEPIVILGAGLTGLSCAYFLDQREHRIFEKETEPGGICRTVRQDGFHFDYTGHLLHFRHPEVRDFVRRLLRDQLRRIRRRAFVRSHGVLAPYPFQANTHRLPPEVNRECLLGFVRAYFDRSERPPPADFEEWTLRHFGAGISKHFMLPYNRKLWGVDLKQLTADWTSRFVPQPKLEDVINGALGIEAQGLGYNPNFLYPKRGGIMALPRALAARVGPIELGAEAIAIDLAKRIVTFSDRRRVGYSRLVSTMPLKRLAAICRDLPAELRAAARRLRHNSVLNLNLGVRRRLGGKHWIYFPEPRWPFYRLGFLSNFSRWVCPPGCAALYLETSYLPQRPPDPRTVYRRSLAALKELGLIRSARDVVVKKLLRIECAYVLFDHHHARSVGALRAYLEHRGVHSVGRYGEWKYSSIEDALVDGRAVATQLCGDVRPFTS